MTQANSFADKAQGLWHCRVTYASPEPDELNR